MLLQWWRWRWGTYSRGNVVLSSKPRRSSRFVGKTLENDEIIESAWLNPYIVEEWMGFETGAFMDHSSGFSVVSRQEKSIN
jgi:hypothetical protein